MSACDTASCHLVRLHVCDQRCRKGKTEETPVARGPLEGIWERARSTAGKAFRSHATAVEIAAGLILPLDAYGSKVADKVAERTALRNALSLEFVEIIRHTDLQVRLVRTRLIGTTLLNVQNKPRVHRVEAKAPVRRAKVSPASAITV